MTIASEISRLQTAKSNIKTSIEGKGVTVPSNTKLDSYDDYIDLIEQKGYDGPYPYGDSDYSAMQGPAPSGFHVPLNTEWQAVYDIRTALGGGSSDGTNFSIALKLPFAGKRGGSGNTDSQGTTGSYWSSSRKDMYSAYILSLSSTNLASNSSSRTIGSSVRCFKDEPVVPTSSWTKLYGTSIEAGGIFWSSTNGLISLSSDGQTWITIADKNLGATTVWNSGNTLSETNCGKYYQRGNNYGFPFTGTVTTSRSQVDASAYGPGNYYSSSTFILYIGSWDSTDNGDLWGGETGIQYEGEYVIINDKNYIYINQPSLLTYEEIVAMATAEGGVYTNTLAELNSNYNDYYNMLNNGGYLKNVMLDPMNTVTCIRGICYTNGTGERNIIIINNNFQLYYTIKNCSLFA